MVILHSYVSLPESKCHKFWHHPTDWIVTIVCVFISNWYVSDTFEVMSNIVKRIPQTGHLPSLLLQWKDVRSDDAACLVDNRQVELGLSNLLWPQSGLCDNCMVAKSQVSRGHIVPNTRENQEMLLRFLMSGASEAGRWECLCCHLTLVFAFMESWQNLQVLLPGSVEWLAPLEQLMCI